MIAVMMLLTVDRCGQLIRQIKKLTMVSRQHLESLRVSSKMPSR